jgi:leader peptidase (prepilin peptidase) / N-methyltransferase
MNANAADAHARVLTEPSTDEPVNCAHMPRTIATVVVGVATAGYVIARSELLLAGRLFIGAGIVLAAIAANHDRRHLRLPNPLVAGIACLGVAAGLVTSSIPTVLASAAIAASPMLLMHLLEPHALGFGDVKYAGATGALVGALSFVAGPILIVVALVAAVINRALHPHGARPLGPIIFTGAIVAATVTATLQQEGWIA